MCRYLVTSTPQATTALTSIPQTIRLCRTAILILQMMASFPKQLQELFSISQSTNVGSGQSHVHWSWVARVATISPILSSMILPFLSRTEGLEFNWETKVILQWRSSESRWLSYLYSLMFVNLAFLGSGVVVNCWSVVGSTNIENLGFKCCTLHLLVFNYSTRCLHFWVVVATGSIHNITFSNIVINTRYYDPSWWGNSEPIYVTACPRDLLTKVNCPAHTNQTIFKY